MYRILFVQSRPLTSKVAKYYLEKSGGYGTIRAQRAGARRGGDGLRPGVGRFCAVTPFSACVQVPARARALYTKYIRVHEATNVKLNSNFKVTILAR